MACPYKAKELVMRWLIVVPVLALAAANCAQPASLAVKDVWARESVVNATNAAVYMTIESQTPDRLIAASATLAGKTDLMTMAGGDEAMGMDYVEAIDVPAKTPVSLDPSGLHVWLADLKQPLEAGRTFPLTLTFEKAGERVVTVSVIGVSAMPPD